MFLPMLAKALGSCERAIVLQQIHWLSRLPNSGVWQDDLHWVYGTYEEWAREYFPMWSHHTLRKHIQNLEAAGVLVSAQLRAHKHDRTKFYRIDYVAVALILPYEVNPIRPQTVDSIQPDEVASINRTKTSAKTSQKKERGAPAQKPEKKNYRPDEYADIIL